MSQEDELFYAKVRYYFREELGPYVKEKLNTGEGYVVMPVGYGLELSEDGGGFTLSHENISMYFNF